MTPTKTTGTMANSTLNSSKSTDPMTAGTRTSTRGTNAMTGSTETPTRGTDVMTGSTLTPTNSTGTMTGIGNLKMKLLTIFEEGGKYLKSVYLPGVCEKILGAVLYTIQNNKLYYLNDNVDKEMWELHIVDIQ
ncbi:MAG: hypothetical protein GY757_25695 [bacterium]|nr:hypothetical protein [bacterium]